MKLEDEIKQKQFRDEYQKLFLNIIFTGNWLNNSSIKTFKPYGISPQQYNVLRILKGQHPKAITVNQIAERMLDKNSNASRLIDKLVLKDFVNRQTCKKDRRQMDVVITDKGLELIEKLNTSVQDLDINISSKLSSKEAKQINDILDYIRD